MSTCLQETSGHKSVLYSCCSYIANFSFSSLTFQLIMLYFPCIRGCLGLLWEVQDIYNLNYERCLQRSLLFIIPYFAIWVQPYFQKKFLLFHSFLWSLHPHALVSVRRLTRALKEVSCLNSPALKSNMDLHAVATVPSVFNSPLLCVFIHVLTIRRRKKNLKQTACTQLKNYRLLQLLLHIARSRRLLRTFLDNEASYQLLALIKAH